MSQETTRPRENRMGTEKVPSLVLKMAVPMMLSMMVQALYNVVDSIFVARLSEDALTAVSLAFPMQNLMISFSVGMGVGINSLLSRSLGEKNQKMVSETARQGLFLQLCSAVLFTLAGLFLSPLFMASQIGDPAIVADGITYLRIVIGICPFLFLSIFFERMLQSTGRTHLSMIGQLVGALTNIALDPVMIFGLLGFPAMGVAGAATATVVGQAAGALTNFLLHHRRNPEVRFSMRGFRPQKQVIAAILSVGIPSIVMGSIGSVMTYCMNRILGVFTKTAIAVFGAYFKLQSFIFMPVFGLNNAMVPIIAYNYGARSPQRMRQAIRSGITYAVAIMVVGFLLMQFLPAFFLGLFDAGPAMLEIGVPALRTISISFLIAGYCIICGSTFQALGKGMYSMLVSVARQLLVLIPAAWLLSKTGQVNAVWWSFPIAEIMSAAVSTWFFLKIRREIIAPLEKE